MVDWIYMQFSTEHNNIIMVQCHDVYLSTHLYPAVDLFLVLFCFIKDNNNEYL